MSAFRIALALFLACISGVVCADSPAGHAWVFFGTYTGKESKGIYRSEIDLATGKLSRPQLAAEVASPSFLAIHPTNKYWDAVGAVDNFAGKKAGAVYAFSLDASTGELKLLNRQSSGGAGPCHLVVDRAGKNVLVANYGGGSVACLPIKPDGTLSPASSFIQNGGNGSNPQRQEGPHAHSINVDAGNRFAVEADLGLDKLLVYRLDADSGKLTLNAPATVSTADGAGPRHFAFHPNGRFAYVINEMASTINAIRYDAEHGKLEIVQTISTLPGGYKGDTTTAEVQVHPSGKFVYGSNRGHDSIAVFKVNPDDGTLSLVGHQAAGIKTPRNFGIDSTGKFMLVANQGSNSVIVFTIDADTGKLKPTGEKIEVGTPVCVKFVTKAK